MLIDRSQVREIQSDDLEWHVFEIDLPLERRPGRVRMTDSAYCSGVLDAEDVVVAELNRKIASGGYAAVAGALVGGNPLDLRVI